MGESMHRRMIVVTLFSGACGPEIVERADLAEACGAEAPVQLLQLDVNESVRSSTTSIVAAGDRYLVGVVEHARPTLGELPDEETITDQRIVSVDACGGDAKVIAEGVDHILAPLDDNSPWLACRYGGGLTIIDPDGEEEPEPIDTRAGCAGSIIAGTRWFLADGDLLRADAGVLTTVAEDVVFLDWQSDERTLLYSTTDLTLWEHDIATGATAAIALDVARFQLTPDDRHIVSTPSTEANDGPWTIRDRRTGDAMTDLSGALRLPEQGVAFDRGGSILYVDLPSFDTFEVPTPSRDGELWNVVGITDDRSLLLWPAHNESVHRVAVDGRAELLHTGLMPDLRFDGRDIWAWDYDIDPAVYDIPAASSRLLRIPLDGGPPETIVDDVHQPLGLDDGRWVSVRDQEARRGDLWVIDPIAGTEAIVDTEVGQYFARLHGPAHVFPTDELHPAGDAFFYMVLDDGDRRGLWRATLAPP